MKKKTILTLLLALAMLCSACSTQPPETTQEPSAPPESTAPSIAAPDPQNITLRILEVTGGDAAQLDTVGSDWNDFAPFTSEAQSLPVYRNPYPTNHGGPLYELTPELETAMRSNLLSFIQLAMPDLSIEEAELETSPFDPYTIECQIDFTTFRSRPNGISISIDQSDLPSSPSEEEILNHPIVEALMTHCGITDPALSAFMDYSLDGSLYWGTYNIIQDSDDPMVRTQNTNFHLLQVLTYSDLDSTTIRLFDYPELEVVQTCTVPSQAAIKDALTQDYPQITAENVQAELFYSSSVEEGLFVPCYRFYIPTGEIDTAGFSIYEILPVYAIAE